MPLTARSPVHLSSAFSSAPYEVMAASQQAHIDDLVQKNRTYEHTIAKLQQLLHDEQAHSADTAKRLRAAAAEERKEWRAGCDSLLGAHRIVHLRTRVEVEKEKMETLKERDMTRRERVKVLQRDFKLSLFIAKEAEMDGKIAELDALVRELREENASERAVWAAQTDHTVADLRSKLAKVEAAKIDASTRLERLQDEMQTLRTESSDLRDANKKLKSTADITSTKLDRMKLQLEGAEASKAQLRSENEELKRTNADLLRQNEKWASLETKGSEDVEAERQKRVALSVEAKALKERVQELEKAEKEREKALEKERRRAAKSSEQVDKLAEVAEEAQKIAERAQKESGDAQTQLAAAHKLVEKLQSKLHADRSESKEKKKTTKGREPTPPTESTDDESDNLPSEKEVEIAITPVARRVKPRPIVKATKDADNPAGREVGEQSVSSLLKRKPEREAEESEAGVEGVAKKRRKRMLEETGAPSREKGKGRAVPAVAEDSDVENPPARRKGKARVGGEGEEAVPGKKSKEKGKASGKAESDTDDGAEAEAARRRNAKGKAKAQDEGESEAEDTLSVKAKARAGGKGKGASVEPTSRRPKPPRLSKPKPKPVDEEPEPEPEDDEATPQPTKKKKRIFANSQPMSFAWAGSLPAGLGDGGLQIPTELSPVKESDVVPARSVFGKVGSALGWRSR